MPSSIGSHCLRLEGVWRDLRALSRTTSFTVREQAGHSLKSSIKVSHFDKYFIKIYLCFGILIMNIF